MVPLTKANNLIWIIVDSFVGSLSKQQTVELSVIYVMKLMWRHCNECRVFGAKQLLDPKLIWDWLTFREENKKWNVFNEENSFSMECLNQPGLGSTANTIINHTQYINIIVQMNWKRFKIYSKLCNLLLIYTCINYTLSNAPNEYVMHVPTDDFEWCSQKCIKDTNLGIWTNIVLRIFESVCRYTYLSFSYDLLHPADLRRPIYHPLWRAMGCLLSFHGRRQAPLLSTLINFNPSIDKSLHPLQSAWCNYLSIPKLQQCNRRRLGMDK